MLKSIEIDKVIFYFNMSSSADWFCISFNLKDKTDLGHVYLDIDAVRKLCKLDLRENVLIETLDEEIYMSIVAGTEYHGVYFYKRIPEHAHLRLKYFVVTKLGFYIFQNFIKNYLLENLIYV